MTISDQERPLAPADDQYERYYTEKIWSWIPEIYRHEDGLAENPGVLRALVEVMADQAAVARRSIDRLWEDQSIEVCDDWAVPLIGDLVGTRMVHELNRRARRADVARTIHYRRRKGTPQLLERLIRDMTGWEGVVVESFRELGRTRHKLDPELAGLEGLLSSTPPGGTPRLTSVLAGNQSDGAFDEFAHTADFRQLRGKSGRFNIPKLNFHLFRLSPFEVKEATPACIDSGIEQCFTFDPSGRDVPLFMKAQRPGSDEWWPARQWELPDEMPCRLLKTARYVITQELADELEATWSPVTRFVGERFESEDRLLETFASLDTVAPSQTVLETILEQALTPDSPKGNLYSTSVAISGDSEILEQQEILAGCLESWGSSSWLPAAGERTEKKAVIDPANGRFWFREAPASVDVPVSHYGFSAEIGAGTYDRRSFLVEDPTVEFSDGTMAVGTISPNDVVEIQDSKTYELDGDITGIEDLVIQATSEKRPYMVRKSANATWTLEAPEDAGSSLTLEGLWLGVEPSTPVSTGPQQSDLVLAGDFDQVVIRHCTLDPGGERARLDPAVSGETIHSVRILVKGTVQKLVIESSIVGAIAEDDGGAIIELEVKDSIIDSVVPGVPAIETNLRDVSLERVTVLGDIDVERLYASELFADGDIKVLDNQRSCVRFSAIRPVIAPDGFRRPDMVELPESPSMLSSKRFGDPDYCRLSERAPKEIRRGAENGSEIGAFSGELAPIKLRDLKAKVSEYAPFGLVSQFIEET